MMNPHGAHGYGFSFPPPPREVRLKPSALVSVWGLRVLMLPFILTGLVSVCEVLKPPLMVVFGSNAMGRVEQVTPHRGRRRDSSLFDVVFTYQLPGESPQSGDGLLNTGGARPPAVGQVLPVRALRIGGMHLTELRNGSSDASGSCCEILFAVVWCGFVALFTAAAWWAPVAARGLVRDGMAAAGTVMGTRRRRTGRTKGCEILYRFTTVDGQQLSGVHLAASSACDDFSEGQAVTVIYDARRPSRSTIYEASDYEVIR